MVASSGDPARPRAGECPCRPHGARRTGARILDTAEGVLAALCRCRVDNAFVELMQTAKQHGVNPVSLADALVTIAEGQLMHDVDGTAAAVARATWAHLLGGRKADALVSAEAAPSDAANDLDCSAQGPVAGRPL